MTPTPTRIPKTIDEHQGRHRQYNHTCEDCGAHWRMTYDNISSLAAWCKRHRQPIPKWCADIAAELLPANPSGIGNYYYLTLNGRVIASGQQSSGKNMHADMNRIWRQSVAEHRCDDPPPAAPPTAPSPSPPTAAPKRRRFGLLRRTR